MKHPPWARRLRWPGLLLVTLGLLYLLRGTFLPQVAKFLDVSETSGQVDCVLVLGGGRETRPFVAAAMLKTGRARMVLIPTVRKAIEAERGLMPDEHEIIRRVLLARGVKAEAIVLLAGEVASTFDEAHALQHFLADHGDASIAVVTNWYHTRRARLVFDRILGAQATRIHFVSAPTDDFDATNWWQSEQGINMCIHEYVKLAYCRFHSG
ncbi:hypothetical protein AYO44_05190 [Planctomycetaceae bacterium SCGC AG-212-F19]|nr:hypothetical protein AYO44_05190 [Planctomycetaceae bacterium SCGC AG-212-F19]